LCKYFKIYGIPYLTLVSLKLDSSLKIIDFRTDKSNIKQAFLDDENGEKFPWTDEKTKLTNEKTTISKKSIIKSTESSSESDKKIVSNESDFNCESIKNFEYDFLQEILKNLSPINEKDKQTAINTYSYDFLFILFGSNQSEINSIVIDNLTEFWKKFHLKHKFIVAYLNYDGAPLKEMPFWFTVLKNNIKVIFFS